MKSKSEGKILTMLDLKDIARVSRAQSINKFMLIISFLVVGMASVDVVLYLKMREARLNLKKAEDRIAALLADRDHLEQRIDAFTKMMKVSLNSDQLQRPVRISGELIVMVGGKVREEVR